MSKDALLDFAKVPRFMMLNDYAFEIIDPKTKKITVREYKNNACFYAIPNQAKGASRMALSFGYEYNGGWGGQEKAATITNMVDLIHLYLDKEVSPFRNLLKKVNVALVYPDNNDKVPTGMLLDTVDIHSPTLVNFLIAIRDVWEWSKITYTWAVLVEKFNVNKIDALYCACVYCGFKGGDPIETTNLDPRYGGHVYFDYPGYHLDENWFDYTMFINGGPVPPEENFLSEGSSYIPCNIIWKKLDNPQIDMTKYYGENKKQRYRNELLKPIKTKDFLDHVLRQMHKIRNDVRDRA